MMSEIQSVQCRMFYMKQANKQALTQCGPSNVKHHNEVGVLW